MRPIPEAAINGRQLNYAESTYATIIINMEKHGLRISPNAWFGP